jgi:hypothetical protein
VESSGISQALSATSAFLNLSFSMIHRMNRILAAALLVAGLPLAAVAQEEPADTVRLRFGWAPGMRADVEYEQVRVRSAEGERDSTRMASTYRLEVGPHAEGLSIRYADVRWTDLPQMEGPAGQFFEALGRTTSGGRPRMVVSSGGEFLRAEGMDEVAAELRQAFEPLMADMQGEGLEALRNMLESMLSEEGVAASAASEWGPLAGAWVDADLEVEAVYELEDSLQVPLFPTVMMPVVVQLEARGRVACTEGGDGTACVELATSTVPDPEGLRRAIGGFLREAGVPEAEMDDVLGQLQLETYATLISEPGTLRPWFLQTTKVITGGDEDAPPLQVDTETYRFRWR